MSKDYAQARRIEAPKVHRGADVGRALAKGAAGAVPLVGSILAEAADLLCPDPADADRRRWEGEVTDGVNHLHGRVAALDEQADANCPTLEGPAAAIAEFMIKRCPDGLARDDLTAEDVQVALPQFDLAEVRDGLAELGSFGLVSSIEDLNGGGFYTLTETSYEPLDPPIMGWDPHEDARHVAACMISLQQPDGIAICELESALGWSRRWLNPALRIVVNLLHSSAIDDTLQPYYVTAGIYLSGQDRARLKHFAANI